MTPRLRLTAMAVALAVAAALPAPASAFERIAESDRSLSRPHDLEVTPDGRYLLVTDMGNDVVKILNPGTLAVLGEFGAGELSAPHDLTFDSQGRVLVADTANNRIAVYHFGGVSKYGGVDAKLLESWEDGISWTEGVAVSADGRIYATNVGTSSVVEVRGGRVVKRFGSSGDGPGEFDRPHDIHVDGEGRILVVDSGNNRIQVLSPELELLRVLEGDPWQFHEPKYVSHAPSGLIYVADEYNSQIKVLTPDFRIHGAIGSGEAGDGPGEINRPEGVDASDRYLWVSDTYNDRILLYRMVAQ